MIFSDYPILPWEEDEDLEADFHYGVNLRALTGLEYFCCKIPQKKHPYEKNIENKKYKMSQMQMYGKRHVRIFNSNIKSFVQSRRNITSIFIILKNILKLFCRKQYRSISGGWILVICQCTGCPTKHDSW